MSDYTSMAGIAVLTAPAVVDLLQKYAIKKGLDGVLSYAKKSYTEQSVEYQLVDALNDSLLETCEEFNWEYDSSAITDTFVSSWESLCKMNSKKSLELVLKNAIGQGEIADNVLDFWAYSWYKQITKEKRFELREFFKMKTDFDLKEEVKDVLKKISILDEKYNTSSDGTVVVNKNIAHNQQIIQNASFQGSNFFGNFSEDQSKGDQSK